jgi:ubiquinone biosynthesis protein
MIAGLPHDLSHLLRAARRGKLEINIEVAHLKHVGNQLDGAANRLTVGLVVAALIVGSAIVMTVPGLHWLGMTGFLAAALNGFWLLISIWRSNRADRE